MTDLNVTSTAARLPRYLKLSAIVPISSTCLIYQQVSSDHRWWSVAVNHLSQSNCHMRRPPKHAFLGLKPWKRCHKEFLKSAAPPKTFSDLSMERTAPVLNLVTLSLQTEISAMWNKGTRYTCTENNQEQPSPLTKKSPNGLIICAAFGSSETNEEESVTK